MVVRVCGGAGEGGAAKRSLGYLRLVVPGDTSVSEADSNGEKK